MVWSLGGASFLQIAGGQQLRNADVTQAVVYYLSQGPKIKEKNFVTKFTPRTLFQFLSKRSPQLEVFVHNVGDSKIQGISTCISRRKCKILRSRLLNCNSSQFEPVVSDIIVTAYTPPLRSSKYRNIVKVHCDQA